MLIVLGIFKFGVSFNNYLTLTDAVRSGARQLALERGQGGSDPSIPCSDSLGRVQSSASSLDQSKLTISVFPTPGSTYKWTSTTGTTGSCGDLVSGNPATVTATYPCDATILGIDFAPGCKLSASATERTE